MRVTRSVRKAEGMRVAAGGGKEGSEKRKTDKETEIKREEITVVGEKARCKDTNTRKLIKRERGKGIRSRETNVTEEKQS